MPHQTRSENDRSIRAQGSVATGGNAEVHDRTGLYIAILALLIAGMALGFEISKMIGAAEVRELQKEAMEAKISEAVKTGEAEASEAKVNARVALKEVETLCASLKAANVKNVDCH